MLGIIWRMPGSSKAARLNSRLPGSRAAAEHGDIVGTVRYMFGVCLVWPGIVAHSFITKQELYPIRQTRSGRLDRGRSDACDTCDHNQFQYQDGMQLVVFVQSACFVLGMGPSPGSRARA